jgi:hypothetical protein
MAVLSVLGVGVGADSVAVADVESSEASDASSASVDSSAWASDAAGSSDSAGAAFGA